jgi:nicotinate-nucleotide pyrophosphorylase (carboxylating)
MRKKVRMTRKSAGPAGARNRPAPSHDIVAIALREDAAHNDLTSRHFVDDRMVKARIFVKENAVVAGVETAAKVFRSVDPRLDCEIVRKDGARVDPGGTVIRLRGSVRAILTAERVALNFLQRLSGIATLTRRYVDAVGSQHTKILDTRKTTPGLRLLEKAAVAAGGGVNHRFGLDDMIMIKDNHLLAAGDLAQLQRAIDRFRKRHQGTRIEIEADTLEQVRAFLRLRGIDLILLDNMSLRTMRKAVLLGARQVLFEASGGITLRRVPRIAATGVDFISVGALTHSAPAIDYSLELLHQ